MLKVKYLHRKSGNSKFKNYHHTRKYKRDNTIDLLSSELPIRQSITSKFKWYNLDTAPLKEFIYSKIGEKWDDVYSEIIKKIKKKFRTEIESCIDYYVVRNTHYDENFIPRYMKYYKNRDILINHPFVDINGILVIKSEQEILSDSKRYIRFKKLEELLKIQENEEIQENDINQSVDL